MCLASDCGGARSLGEDARGEPPFGLHDEEEKLQAELGPKGCELSGLEFVGAKCWPPTSGRQCSNVQRRAHCSSLRSPFVKRLSVLLRKGKQKLKS